MLTQVADGVLVHQSELLQNNAVVVKGRAGVLLIDPGLTGDEMTCLAKDLPMRASPWWRASRRIPIGITCSGTPNSAMRPVTARPAARISCEICVSNAGWKARVVEGLPPEIADEIPLDLFGLITGLPAGTARIPWDGPGVRIIEHPAHAPGHAALLIEERGVLIAGDMLSDVLIPMLDDVNSTNDPIEDYLIGLRLLEGVADDVGVVIPGHGSVGGAGRYRHASHRTARTSMPCVTAVLPMTRASAHRPSPAGNGSAMCTRGRPRASPDEPSATGRPGSDPLTSTRATRIDALTSAQKAPRL